MGALYAAISGLNAEQTALNVVAENIANTNTVGYKSSSVRFAEALLQTLSAGSAPSATLGGTNPIQVAAGSAVNPAAVAVNMAQGSLQATGSNTDMAIQGAGFFVVKTPNGYAYTRAGNFHLDANGELVTAQGDPVLGWTAGEVQNGLLTPQNLGPLTIPIGTTLHATATSGATLTGNLNSTNTGTANAASTSYSVPMTLYDQAGNSINVTLVFSDPTAVSGTTSSGAA
ncbi:MAG: flagellar hook-basal body complex protein, partial [Firmicutes bacterium]|nr:flagellar hook-basal body complex protein [Bacillota bacterium]